MSKPKVSVIIPTYKGAGFLGETIQSVLGQTFSNWEVIIVDDASPDDTASVVAQWNDPRIRYLVHAKNQGSEAARDTGLRASDGALIIFLDQDDLLHPDKMETHVAFFQAHPDVGVTYNARFNLNHSSSTVRDIWRPPQNVTLADLVLGFPFSPSDVVLRREWACRMDLLQGSLSWCGGEIVHYGHLYLSGCQFAGIDRVLNYRRYHADRVIRDLEGGCKSELYAQDKIFADPRCPADVLALEALAHANIYLIWAFRALAQGVTALGNEFLGAAVRLKPTLLRGTPCELTNYFMSSAIENEWQDHAALLKKIFDQLPAEMTSLAGQYDWAVTRDYLLKGVRAILWDRPEDGQRHLEQAAKRGMVFDRTLVDELAYTLLEYEMEFGEERTQSKLRALASNLEKFGGRAAGRKLIGCYAVNRAFQNYRNGEYRQVPQRLMPALANEPKYLANRGVLAIFVRSIYGMWMESAQAH